MKKQHFINNAKTRKRKYIKLRKGGTLRSRSRSPGSPITTFSNLIKHMKDENFRNFKYELDRLIQNVPLLNLDELVKNDKTLLMIAATECDYEFVQELIRRGANIDAMNSLGQTVFMLLCFKGESTRIKRLLNPREDIKKPDINHRDINGFTALMHLCFKGRRPLVELLIENRVDVNATDVMGNSAIHYASMRGNPTMLDIVEALVIAGSDYQARNDMELEPLDYAVRKRNKPVARYLGELKGMEKEEVDELLTEEKTRQQEEMHVSGPDEVPPQSLTKPTPQHRST